MNRKGEIFPKTFLFRAPELPCRPFSPAVFMPTQRSFLSWCRLLASLMLTSELNDKQYKSRGPVFVRYASVINNFSWAATTFEQTHTNTQTSLDWNVKSNCGTFFVSAESLVHGFDPHFIFKWVTFMWRRSSSVGFRKETTKAQKHKSSRSTKKQPYATCPTLLRAIFMSRLCNGTTSGINGIHQADLRMKVALRRLQRHWGHRFFLLQNLLYMIASYDAASSITPSHRWETTAPVWRNGWMNRFKHQWCDEPFEMNSRTNASRTEVSWSAVAASFMCGIDRWWGSFMHLPSLLDRSPVCS